ncbi:MAG: DUF2232 domain-containing protein [Bdellovibrionales bacterium]
MASTLPSRGMQGYAGGILAGLVSALLFGFGFSQAGSIFFMLSTFAAVPLFIAGLGAGLSSALTASVTGVASLAFTLPSNIALFYLVAFGLPAAVLASLALRQEKNAEGRTEWYSGSNILVAVVIYPCLAFLAAFAAAIDKEGGLLGRSKAMFAASTTAFREQFQTDRPDLVPVFDKMVEEFPRLLPSVLGSAWAMIIALSIVVAQATLKQQKWNLRPGFDLGEIRLPAWLLAITAAAGLADLFAPEPYDYLGLNIWIMLTLGFFIVGVAIVHRWAATKRWGKWALVLYYVLLAVPYGWTATPPTLLTLFLGFTDQWIDFRRRFAGQKQGG